MPKQFANAQDLVAVKEVRDGVLVLRDGSLRQILMVNGMNFALRSETEQNTITSGYQNFLNTLDFPLQVIIHSRRINISKYLDKLGGFEKTEPSPLLRNQNSEYREFIRGFVEKNAIMEKTFFVVIPWVTVALPSTRSILRFIPFLKQNENAAAAAAEEKEGDFKESLEQLNQRTAQVIEGLNAIGLEAVALGNKELAEMLYNFYNPESVEREDLTIPGSEAKT
ncbi:MAG: hypothetical protein FJY98_00935 [Candidatus Liptonbacteria bacterium]|nr:hypothetical protein [Candidatus Liptonbacteria bacterium]